MSPGLATARRAPAGRSASRRLRTAHRTPSGRAKTATPYTPHAIHSITTGLRETRRRTARPAGRRNMARLALLALLSGAAALVPNSRRALPARRSAARMQMKSTMVMEDTYWEGEAPPSYVLGNLANAPSGLLGPMSGVFLLVGLYCVSASQLGSPLTAATVNPFYIAGSLCVPVSWGLHVAAWIQKKNNM